MILLTSYFYLVSYYFSKSICSILINCFAYLPNVYHMLTGLAFDREGRRLGRGGG